MRKQIIILLSILILGIGCYFLLGDLEKVIKARLREMAKQELIAPIKKKWKKFLRRSKVRQYKKRHKLLRLEQQY